MSSYQIEIFKFVFLAAFFISGWAALQLWVKKEGHTLANKALSAFIAVMLFPVLNYYGSLAFPGELVWLDVLTHSFIWLYGPFLWLFLQLLLHKKFVKNQLLLSLIPFATVTGIYITYHFLAIDVPLWVTFAACLQALIYMACAIFITIKYHTQMTILFKAYSNSSFYWLLYLSVGAFSLLMLDVYILSHLLINAEIDIFFRYTSVALIAVYLFLIACCALLRPEIVFAPTTKEEEAYTQIAVDVNEHASQTASRKLELSDTATQALAAELQLLMTQQRLYRRNDLSLPKLSEAVGISTHLLSELLNAHLNTNFYEYINRYRIFEAMELLVLPNLTSSVTDIAYQVGFNNLNSFYRAFKSQSPLSPVQFRKNALQPATTFTGA